MKVSSEISRIASIYNQNVKPVKPVEAKKNVGDRVDISNVGREFSKYVEIASKSEIENPRVNEIKKLISDNKYEVDSEKLAKSILDFIKERDV